MLTPKVIFSFCFAIILGVAAKAQSCDTFFNADAINPFLHSSSMPTGAGGVDFVDIDGDGDLDCYAAGAGYYMNLIPKHKQRQTSCV